MIDEMSVRVNEYGEKKKDLPVFTIIGIGIIGFFILSEILPQFFSWALFTFIPMDYLPFPMQMFIMNFLNLITFILVLAIPFVLIGRVFNMQITEMFPIKRYDKVSLFPMVLVGLAFTGVGVTLADIFGNVASFFGIRPVMGEMYLPENGIDAIFFLLLNCVVPAILEELAFRGVILKVLRRYSDSFAIIMSAFLFSIMHGNYVQAPHAFVIGLFLGFITIKTGSIIAASVTHFTINFVAVLPTIMVAVLGEQIVVDIFGILLIQPLINLVYIALGFIGFAYIQGENKSFFNIKEGTNDIAVYKKFIKSPATIAMLFIIFMYTINNFQWVGW